MCNCPAGVLQSDSKLENPNRELKDHTYFLGVGRKVSDSKLENPNRELKGLISLIMESIRSYVSK